MKFERGKTVADALSIGRSPDAVKISGVSIDVLRWNKHEHEQEPPMGRYFRSPELRTYELDLDQAYSFVKLVIKKDLEALKKLLNPLLSKYSVHETLCFLLKFEKDTNDKPSKVYFQDLKGCDISINGDLLEIPKGRIIKNSDFQIHFNGTGFYSSEKKLNDLPL